MAYAMTSLPKTLITSCNTNNKKSSKLEIVNYRNKTRNLNCPSTLHKTGNSRHKSSVLNKATSPQISFSLPGVEEKERTERSCVKDNENDQFDHGAPPPFTMAEIRAVIPKHCWVKDTWKSMSYVVRDFLVIFAFAGLASYLDSWVVWPGYWFAQGTMFWALFAIGHDCGHGSFSNSHKLNAVVGHLVHTAILVPYHGMRISHKKHHQNQGHAEKDESWHPWTEKLYRSVDYSTRFLRYTVPFPLFAYPFYLFMREPGKKGSHFHPESDLFLPSDRNDVITSSICWGVMVSLLLGLGFFLGPIQMLKLYGVPYLVFVMWIDFVTYLNHHGHGEESLPWYRGKEWNYLRGALTTLDRDYGLFNKIHHDIGTHVIHHLFPQIPHYHLVEATEAAKPILGKYYKEPKKSGLLPFHLIGSYLEGLKHNHFVSDTGEVVYYQTDPHIYEGSKSK